MVQSAYTPLPLGDILPDGWLERQLRIQAQGLTGHLEEIWDSVGSYSGWLGGTGERWERGPYYLDGLVPLAYLLQDEALIAKSRKWIEWTLASQQADGWFGPALNADWWPRMVMLKVLTQVCEATGDARIPPFLHRYFRYQLAHLAERPLYDWGVPRGGDNLLSVLWLYRRDPQPYLLDLAGLILEQTQDWTDLFTDFPYTRPIAYYYRWQDALTARNAHEMMHYHTHHVVDVAMGVKQPMLKYLVTGNPADREAVGRGIDNLMRFHGLAHGMFSGDEHLHGTHPSQGTELCAVAEYLFSLEQLLWADGNARWGDIAERVAYNALPGTFSTDMWTHQYLQQPNQIACDDRMRDWYNNDQYANTFGLEPHFGCCTANMHQAWPKWVASLFMAAPDGLTAALYGPCRVDTTLPDGRRIALTERTDYPFEDTIRLRFDNSPGEITLRLRVPAWCAAGQLAVNGRQLPCAPEGGYVTLRRAFSAGDEVALTLPMQPRVEAHAHDSVSVAAGPLVFSLGIGEDWQAQRAYGDTPLRDWHVLPTTAWNYALDPEAPLTLRRHGVAERPFETGAPAVTVEASVHRAEAWGERANSADLPPAGLTAGDVGSAERIALVPYGGAKLRITQFPKINQ